MNYQPVRLLIALSLSAGLLLALSAAALADAHFVPEDPDRPGGSPVATVNMHMGIGTVDVDFNRVEFQNVIISSISISRDEDETPAEVTLNFDDDDDNKEDPT